MNQNEHALGVEGIVQDIRALLRHNETSIDERPMMMLQNYCDELLEYAGLVNLFYKLATDDTNLVKVPFSIHTKRGDDSNKLTDETGSAHTQDAGKPQTKPSAREYGEEHQARYR